MKTQTFKKPSRKNKILERLKTHIKEVLNQNIESHLRLRSIVDAKKIYSKISKEHYNLTFKEIGDSLGKDHSCAQFYYREANVLVKTNKLFKKKYNQVLKGVSVPDFLQLLDEGFVLKKDYTHDKWRTKVLTKGSITIDLTTLLIGGKAEIDVQINSVSSLKLSCSEIENLDKIINKK